jgi:hypothetical protein
VDSGLVMGDDRSLAPDTYSDSNTNPDNLADAHSTSINEEFDDITRLVGMSWFM